VPVYLIQGEHEARGRAQPAQEWFNKLQAPTKRLITFDTAGHRTLFEEPEQFHAFMINTVLTETSTAR